MAKIKIYYLAVLLLSVVSVLYGSEEEHNCCPAGQYITTEDTEDSDTTVINISLETSLCYDLKTNATSKLAHQCPNNNATILNKSQLNYHVNSKGQLVLELPNIEGEVENGSYCLGSLINIIDESEPVNAVAVICDVQEEVRVVGEEVLASCMIISCCFLTLTAIIYIALPELRDLQGKSIINLCASLALGFAILAHMKLLTEYSDMTLCAMRGFFVYFFMIAGFFWMNVISIQIMFSMRRPVMTSSSRKEFLWYFLYAWGTAAVLTAAMAIVNFVPGNHRKPGIALNTCWFLSKKEQWQYMYSVMTILIVANICIFVYTSIHLWRSTFESKHLKAVRYKFLMMLRLFVVMGVSWIFEMVGSLFSSHVIWEILDILNTLQGVYIFLVVVVFRRRVVQTMYNHGWLSCCAGPVERYLAVGDNDEDEVEHTIAVPMDTVKQ